MNDKDVVILYDNDVHCSIDGYANIAAQREVALKHTPHVSLVSCGDYAAGKSLGAISKGEYIIRVMNAVKYDYVTIGNHEFDFGIPQMQHLLGELNSKVVCCNLIKETDKTSIYDSYAIQKYEEISVAFIGVATPATISSGNPATFQDEKGNFEYSFAQKDIVQVVQKQVDAARAAGADYVVVLSHLGIEPPAITSPELIAQTSGIDVLLDGHSHSVIEGRMVDNSIGKPVLLTSTGCDFANVGMLIIHSDGTFETHLISKDLFNPENMKSPAVLRVQEEINTIKEEYAAVGNRSIGYSDVALRITGDDGKRIARNHECNLGDLAADAMRITQGADIGWANGGGCRGNIEAGPLTFNSVYSVFPFDNKVCVIDVPGKDILDALEMAAHAVPNEFGGFAQISGITFTIDTSIPSSVVLDENQVFVKVTGKRRVSDVRVFDSKAQSYKKICPRKHYTIAGTEFVLMRNGDGITFPHSKVLKNTAEVDNLIVEQYIREFLNGKIGEQYRQAQGRITIR